MPVAAQVILLVIIHIVSLGAACHALLTKADPRAALGWAVALVFLPLIGLAAYFIFGISRAHSHAEEIMRRIAALASRFTVVPSKISPANLGSPEAATLDRLGFALTSVPLCGGNSVTPLHNGDAAYPAMLAAIDAAREHVFLGSYIFNYGNAAKRFIAALQGAHDRGVDVRVLVDGVGSLYSWRKPWRILADHGVKTTRFRPLTLIPPNFGINLRSHRKVLVCDAIGFTGGMNIADGNLLKLNPGAKGKIQDVQFRCEGPIVSQLRDAFLLNWAFCSGELSQLAPLPDEPRGQCDCRVVVDGPGDDRDAINDIICSAINIARKNVLIMTPYFLPTPSLMAALKSAAQRGVAARVIIPGHNNLPYMSWATERVLPELLMAGVRVWRQAPPFAHTKLLCVDEFYSFIGSANLDSRSLLLNFELNMEVYDSALHDALTKFMEDTLAKGQEVTLTELKNRSLPARLRDSACWVFSPYL